jgi:cobalamin biosynthesis Mg chelatase CobN
MGVASSKNKSTYDAVNATLSENLSQTLIKIAQQSVSSAAATQMVRIRATAEEGDVTVSGVQQISVMNVNITKFIQSVTDSSLKAMMSSALEASVKENQEVEHQLTIGGSIVKNDSGTSIRSEAINRIINSYTLDQFISDSQQILGSQEVDITALARKNVTISNINQYVKIELLSSQISQAMTKTITEMATENESVSSKSLTQTSSAGFSLGIALIVIVIIAIIAGLIWWKMSGSRATRGMGYGRGFEASEDDFGWAV